MANGTTYILDGLDWVVYFLRYQDPWGKERWVKIIREKETGDAWSYEIRADDVPMDLLEKAQIMNR